MCNFSFPKGVYVEQSELVRVKQIYFANCGSRIFI